MAKDIEKIIENSIVPDMEYVKQKQHRSVTLDDEVPEIVLPKTKAEMYEEAKDRLEQKTSAVSKAYEAGKKTKDKQKSTTKKRVKTVELETAAAAVVGNKSNAEHEDFNKLKTRLIAYRKIVDEPKWVGNADELIPFAWRMPLKADIARPTKFYRAATQEGGGKKPFLPAPRKTP